MNEVCESLTGIKIDLWVSEIQRHLRRKIYEKASSGMLFHKGEAKPEWWSSTFQKKCRSSSRSMCATRWTEQLWSGTVFHSAPFSGWSASSVCRKTCRRSGTSRHSSRSVSVRRTAITTHCEESRHQSNALKQHGNWEPLGFIRWRELKRPIPESTSVWWRRKARSAKIWLPKSGSGMRSRSCHSPIWKRTFMQDADSQEQKHVGDVMQRSTDMCLAAVTQIWANAISYTIMITPIVVRSLRRIASKQDLKSGT